MGITKGDNILMRRKKWLRQPSKYEKDAFIATGIVTEIIMKNEEINGKRKTVFKVPSMYCPEGRICVYWEMTGVEVGDEVTMKGRFNGDVFLVWSMHYKRPQVNNDDKTDNQHIS